MHSLHAVFGDPEVMAWWNTPLRTDIPDTRADLGALVNVDGTHVWAVGAGDSTVKLVGLLGDVQVSRSDLAAMPPALGMQWWPGTPRQRWPSTQQLSGKSFFARNYATTDRTLCPRSMSTHTRGGCIERIRREA